ncbi:anoctamin-5-like isoform X2 [Palaemon carinicauda]|uniref:anoctamin-5-like isoform X2 n=1 Tax=Palaemon carinicauda TaxID=392227 RepID=UPI0035B604DC
MDAMFQLYSAYRNIMTEQRKKDDDNLISDPEQGKATSSEEQREEAPPTQDEEQLDVPTQEEEEQLEDTPPPEDRDDPDETSPPQEEPQEEDFPPPQDEEPLEDAPHPENDSRPPVQGQEEDDGVDRPEEQEERETNEETRIDVEEDNSWDEGQSQEEDTVIENPPSEDNVEDEYQPSSWDEDFHGVGIRVVDPSVITEADEDLIDGISEIAWRGEPEGAVTAEETTGLAEPPNLLRERRLSLSRSLSELYVPQPVEDVLSNVSYESVHLPGSISDFNNPAEHSGLNSKYRRMAEPFQVKKSSDTREVRKTVETLFFRDNKRRIDFVLAYKEEDDPEKVERRRVYEQNLKEEGLELETEDKTQSQNGLTYFVKIHAPWDLLVRYAEIMKLKKPIKKDDTELKKRDIYSFFGIKDPFMYNEKLIPKEPSYFSTGFSRSRVEQFIIKDRESFFTPSQRSQIVWEILLRVRYTDAELGIGISRLLSNETYAAAFPLHDGRYDKDNPDGTYCDRRLLYLEWAHPGKWYKKQPLHVIRRYFGDKMALYFAWLGFYTKMLVPASILGGFTFICGLFVMYSDFNKPSEEICDESSNSTGSLVMCPLCDEVCTFWKLSDSCLNSRITFLFDNPFTVFFSIAMSFWATMFLELWKRKQSVIQWQWDLENYEEEEEFRPQFHEKVTSTRINPVTKKSEPYLPPWKKISRVIASGSLVLLMLFVVLAAVFAVTLYRIAVAVSVYKTDNEYIRTNARLITSITAAFINLLLIIILNYFYEKLVVWLTNLEIPRTQTEYEDSFTLKMFLFQFINYYASLIYIAFFKGRFFFHPGDAESRANVFMNVRSDMCDPAGCLFELFVQLAIIMVGKQFFNNVIEIFIPIVQVWWKKKWGHDNELSEAYTRWEQDYDLTPYTSFSLFGEYLEMAIQYGFVTLFVAAFPLAPFFALINNIVEIRLDAYKYLTQSRRPRAERIQDIGIWYGILKGITYCSVITNAFVISYTSDFIPRLVYMFGYSDNHNLVGYVSNTLSVFYTNDYEENMGPDKPPREDWPSECHYRAYRNNPDDDKPYAFTLQFWHVATARLSFIIIFEHIVFFLTGIVALGIPDIPVEVRNQMKREKKVEKETLFENEMRKIREERHGRQSHPKQNIDDDLNGDLGEGLGSRPNSRATSAPSAPKYFKNHHI